MKFHEFFQSVLSEVYNSEYLSSIKKQLEFRTRNSFESCRTFNVYHRYFHATAAFRSGLQRRYIYVIRRTDPEPGKFEAYVRDHRVVEAVPQTRIHV